MQPQDTFNGRWREALWCRIHSPKYKQCRKLAHNKVHIHGTYVTYRALLPTSVCVPYGMVGSGANSVKWILFTSPSQGKGVISNKLTNTTPSNRVCCTILVPAAFYSLCIFKIDDILASLDERECRWSRKEPVFERGGAAATRRQTSAPRDIGQAQ
jgi:hypothetical protein